MNLISLTLTRITSTMMKTASVDWRWFVKTERWVGDGTWERPGAEGVREAAGMQLAMTYIGRPQETMAQ